jgi:hypothetical protein
VYVGGGMGVLRNQFFSQFATPGENHSRTRGFLLLRNASPAVNVNVNVTLQRGIRSKLDGQVWRVSERE